MNVREKSLKESRATTYKTILPAFQEFVRALDIVAKHKSIWKETDLTFMLLQSRMYLQGAVDELLRLIEEDKLKSEMN